MQSGVVGKTERSRLALEIAWFLIAALVSATACLNAAQRLGPTWDETIYFEYGLRCWEEGHHGPLAGWGTMPLPVDVQTLPLAIAKFGFGVDPRSDFIGFLPYFRMMTLLFWWWLLGACYLTARARGGVAAACLTVGLLAAEPVLLGHAALGTTDIAASATLVTVLFVFQRCYDRGTSPRLRRAATACAVATALMAKATAFVFVPICLFAVELERLLQAGWRPRADRNTWLSPAAAVRECAIVFGLGLLLVAVLFPRMLYAFYFQIRHNVQGHGLVYLLGRTDENGFWYYFFVALTSKLSLTLLGFLGVAALFGRRNLLNAPWLAATALLIISPSYRVQTGVRFVFSVIVLFAIGASVALFGRRSSAWPTLLPRRVGLTLAMLAILGSTIEAYRVWPNGLCFTNQLFGGTERGYLTLCESNYDWGQGYDDLAAWHRAHDLPELNVWYFGTDPRWETGPMTGISGGKYTEENFSEFLADNHGRFLAVSLSNLYAYQQNTPAGRFLLSRKPCARTQTFLIYDFRRSEPPQPTDMAQLPPLFMRRK